MTDDEYAAFLEWTISSFAESIAAAGETSPADAYEHAERQVHQLLPEGPRTPGMLLRTAEVDGEPVGQIWLALSRPGRPGTGFVYNLLVHPEYRGRGYGRAIMLVAESEIASCGVTSLALDVFARNTTAVRLYANLGYKTVSQQMAKTL